MKHGKLERLIIMNLLKLMHVNIQEMQAKKYNK